MTEELGVRLASDIYVARICHSINVRPRMATARHFVVADDGSNYEIIVQSDFIYIQETSSEVHNTELNITYIQETSSEVHNTELNITYTIENGQAQTAEINIRSTDTFPSQRWQIRIPAMWPALRERRETSPYTDPNEEYRQLPGLQAFFKRCVDNGLLSETCSRSITRTTVQTHVYTYTVQKPAVLKSDARNVYLVDSDSSLIRKRATLYKK